MKILPFNRNINLTVMHNNGSSLADNGKGLLRFAASNEPLAGLIFEYLNGSSYRKRSNIIAIPESWFAQATKAKSNVIYYRENPPVPLEVRSRTKTNQWFTISNGRFVTRINHQWLHKILAQLKADVVAVNVTPQLQATCEKVLITPKNKLVGFRRFYSDSAQPTPPPNDWPHHLFVKIDALDKLLVDGALPPEFPKLTKSCSENSLTVTGLDVGGAVLDLDTKKGLLDFLTIISVPGGRNNPNAYGKSRNPSSNENPATIAGSARLFGKVFFGRNVRIGQNAIIVGPAVICNNVKVAQGAVVKTSIIGAGVSVPPKYLVQNSVFTEPQSSRKSAKKIRAARITFDNSSTNGFRTWPKFAYTRCFKRFADIVAAAVVLVLFAPVLPIIALAIKLNSRGPVFFKDTREGLHGKAFNCPKFRTMTLGADKIQSRLRSINQVDGPQFRIKDDPRVSTVGRFLRDTYIDEIPQFFNVLIGQMSVVGPRPSPRAENTLCPSWRDARLSVRPGITGLWQVYRTRQPAKDFQEWIHYDVKYVRELSLNLDLRICWQTAKKMTRNFINQF